MKAIPASISPLAAAAAAVLAFSVPCAADTKPGGAPAVEIVASPEKGWPQFRGPRRDGVSDEKGLLQTWPEGGPKKLWSAENLGRGFSSPTIAGGKLFITGDHEGELHVYALDLAGKPLWTAKNGGAWRDPYPGARATVTYSDGALYLMNANGRLACLDAATGKERWAEEILTRFEGKNITWGLSECLQVDERAVYVTAGGAKALVVAFDKRTGQVLWQSDPLMDTQGDGSAESASYVSPILVQFAGRRLLIGCSLRHLYCVDAGTGKMQWTRRFPTTYSVISMMPAIMGNSVFMTAPHGRGGKLFELLPPAGASGAVDAKEVWSTRLDTLQGCVVQVGEKTVGSFYGGRKGWAAMNSRTGEVIYDSSDYIKGAPLLADGRIYALCEDGKMVLLEAGEREFVEHGKFELAKANRDAWAHPVIHEGRLYLRYHETLSCYDVKR